MRIEIAFLSASIKFESVGTSGKGIPIIIINEIVSHSMIY